MVRCTATASDGALTGEAFAEVTVEAPQAGAARSHPRLGTLRYVPAGSFTMGCVAGRDDVLRDCGSLESPSRTVTLTSALWVMESELTQAQWAGLGFQNPSGFSGMAKPVERVNWWEAIEAANAASREDGLAECYVLTSCNANVVGEDRECLGVSVSAGSGHPKDCAGWRLPTEAEWEYAARAGTSLPFAGSDDVDQVAWYDQNSGSKSQPVCTTPTPRNAWGLCDLSGNVGEWCWDWLATSYVGAATIDPTGPTSGTTRVVRGGVFRADAGGARASYRAFNSAGSRFDSIGLRLVRSAP